MGEYLELYYQKNEYVADGSLAIQTYAMDDDIGFIVPYGMVTVCLVDYGMTPEAGTVYMPTYKMTPDFIGTVLVDIVDEIISEVQIGYGRGLHVRLRPDWESRVKMME